MIKSNQMIFFHTFCSTIITSKIKLYLKILLKKIIACAWCESFFNNPKSKCAYDTYEREPIV